MIDLVLVKKDMLHYAVRGMGRGLSDPHALLNKVKLMGVWIKTIETVNGVRRITSEKLREHQYTEGYFRCLENKRIEWDEQSKVDHMWE